MGKLREQADELLRLHLGQQETWDAIHRRLQRHSRARLELHRTGKGSQFVKKYGVMRLVYMEEYATPLEAIQREKQIKEWRRDWKIRRIEENNPDWRDLSHLL